jgi:hypothetical protein
LFGYDEKSIMNKLITPGDIIYFSDGPFRSYGSNLKLFISFLKLTGEHEPLKFSYTGPDKTLIHDMTVEENILLSLDNNMIDNKRLGFLKKHMARINNPALKQLFQDLEQSCHLHMYPEQVTEYTAKKILIIKALLQPTTYMIFEHQNIDLDPQTLELFKQAVQFETSFENKIAMLSDQRHSCWQHLASKVIELTFNKKLSFQLCSQSNSDVRELVSTFPKKIAA